MEGCDRSSQVTRRRRAGKGYRLFARHRKLQQRAAWPAPRFPIQTVTGTALLAGRVDFAGLLAHAGSLPAAAEQYRVPARSIRSSTSLSGGVLPSQAVSGCESFAPWTILVIDVVARAVVGARIGHAERFLERDRDPVRSAPLVSAQVTGQRASGTGLSGRNTESGRDAVGIRRAGLLNDVVGAIDLVVPGTAVPVVVADEVKDTGSLNVQRDVEIVGELVQEVGSVGPFVAAGSVVGAAHVGPRADPLIRPAFPQAIGVEPDRNDGGFGRDGYNRHTEHEGKRLQSLEHSC